MKELIIRDRIAHQFLVQAKTWRSAWQVASRPTANTDKATLYAFRALMRDYAKFAIYAARSYSK